MSINPWDIALAIVVTLQATALAYISSPRWKALMLMLPLPFTTIVISLGRPLDTSNLLAMVVLLVYTLSVRTLYQYIPIVPAIALSALRPHPHGHCHTPHPRPHRVGFRCAFGMDNLYSCIDHHPSPPQIVSTLNPRGNRLHINDPIPFERSVRPNGQ